MNTRRLLRAIAAMCAVILLPMTMQAQTTGQIAVGAGSATDERGVRSNAVMILPSVTFASGADAALSIGGDATFFQNDQWSLGGMLGAHSRGAIGGGFAVALNADADASRTSYDATFATAELTPSLEFSWSALTLFGGLRGAAGYTGVTTTQPAVQGIPGPGTTVLVSETRTLYTPTYGGRLRVMGPNPETAAQFMYQEEPMHVGNLRVTDRTLSGAMIAGPLTLAASAGRREAPDEQLTFGSGTLEYELSSGVSLDLGAGRYPSNRLTGAAGGNYVSAGVSLNLGGSRPHALPRARGVEPPPRGTTRLTIRAPDAQEVEVAGDWDDWQLVPAIRADNGVWYADLRVPPGQYRYAFRIDGRTWRVPDGAVAVDDGFGGKSAYVTVRGASATDSHDPGEER